MLHVATGGDTRGVCDQLIRFGVARGFWILLDDPVVSEVTYQQVRYLVERARPDTQFVLIAPAHNPEYYRQDPRLQQLLAQPKLTYIHRAAEHPLPLSMLRALVPSELFS